MFKHMSDFGLLEDLPEKRAEILNRLAREHRYLLVPILEELTAQELKAGVDENQ